MGFPEQQPINDEDARRLVHDLVQLFQAPARIFGPRSNEKPITIADIIRLGIMMAGGVNESNQDELLQEHNQVFLGKLCKLIDSPEAMEAYLSDLIISQSENAGDIHEAIAQVNAMTHGPRADVRFVRKAIEEMMPKLPPGRPTGFKAASDRQQFLDLVSHLEPICANVLRLKEQFSRKSLKELLAFLESEEPQTTMLLRKHADHVAQMIAGPDFQKLKENPTRARRIADAVAGFELFGWSFSYAVQKGAEFRRASRVGQKE